MPAERATPPSCEARTPIAVNEPCLTRRSPSNFRSVDCVQETQLVLAERFQDPQISTFGSVRSASRRLRRRAARNRIPVSRSAVRGAMVLTDSDWKRADSPATRTRFIRSLVDITDIDTVPTTNQTRPRSQATPENTHRRNFSDPAKAHRPTSFIRVHASAQTCRNRAPRSHRLENEHYESSGSPLAQHLHRIRVPLLTRVNRPRQRRSVARLQSYKLIRLGISPVALHHATYPHRGLVPMPHLCRITAATQRENESQPNRDRLWEKTVSRPVPHPRKHHRPTISSVKPVMSP